MRRVRELNLGEQCRQPLHFYTDNCMGKIGRARLAIHTCIEVGVRWEGDSKSTVEGGHRSRNGVTLCSSWLAWNIFDMLVGGIVLLTHVVSVAG